MTAEDWRRVGKLEAEVESIRLQWATYKDELHRLVQRLEKRDQRAEERATRAAEPEPQPAPHKRTKQELRRLAFSLTNRGGRREPGNTAGNAQSG